MSISIRNIFLGGQRKKEPVLLAITPPRSGERTLLGVENLLASIAVPEPFSLELAGDAAGVTLLARCLDDQVVRGQIAARYPQARITTVDPDDDPLRLAEGELAWGMTLRASGPEYAPLRTFRDDDLLDPGSDPLIAIIGALSGLNDGERVVAPAAAALHGAGVVPGPPAETPAPTAARRRPVRQQHPGHPGPDQRQGRRDPGRARRGRPGGAAGLPVVPGRRATEGVAAGRGHGPGAGRRRLGLVALEAGPQPGLRPAADPGEDLPHRLRRRSPGDGHPARGRRSRPGRGTAGAGGRRLPALRQPRRRQVPGQQHQIHGGQRPPAFRRAGAVRQAQRPGGEGGGRPVAPAGSRGRDAPGGPRRVPGPYFPPAKSTSGGALVGETTTGPARKIHFPQDLLRRHHLYVARTRMGKSTLMEHVIVHKLREKAAGNDTDAIIVVDPHADLVGSVLAQVPESLVQQVRLIDLADQRGFPGINLLDTRIFADRDRTADSVVRVAHGLWEQWGPRMQSILEHAVKSLHEANEKRAPEEQYTILDGLRLLSDDDFRDEALGQVDDHHLLAVVG